MSCIGLRRLAGATDLVSPISAQYGDGAGWVGSAANGKTAIRRRKKSFAKPWEFVWSRNTFRLIAGILSDGARRRCNGSPAEWREQTAELVDGKTVAALGPYPSRGEYEHVFTLEGPNGEFVQLTPAIVEQLSRMIEASRRIHRGTGRETLYRREVVAESRYDGWADTVLDDAGGAFHGAPHVVVPEAVLKQGSGLTVDRRRTLSVPPASTSLLHRGNVDRATNG